MCFNKNCSFRIGAAVLAAVLFSGREAAPAVPAGQASVADRIVAVVNDRIVTWFDLRVVETFGIIEGPLAADLDAARRAILEKLIDRMVVADLALGKSPVDPDRVSAEIDRIALRFGEEEFAARLSRFGLTRGELRPYLEEKILVETVIAERFGRSVSVSLKEIETRYQDRFLPAEKAAGREPPAFLAVVDVLEREIRAEKISIQAALWIQTLRDQAEIEIRLETLKK